MWRSSQSVNQSTYLGNKINPRSRPNTIPIKRHELMKWYGWGYKDTEWKLDEVTGQLKCTGNRYPEINKNYNPQNMKDFIMKNYNIDINDPDFERKQDLEMPVSFTEPIINENFVTELDNLNLTYSIDGEDRYFRARGNEAVELLIVRQQQHFPRMPDLVVFPNCHDDVVNIVELASLHNVVIIPFGGGTNVTRALECNPEEKRMIVSLDTSQMNRVLWVDKTNLTACCESGIIGQDLGRELEKQGLTTGHEPDSYEFSSLGGWVATRASGMKKNMYGNIEDLVVHVRFVTPSGVLEKQNQAPRVSCGPDFNQIVLGSEGTLGVVTEVIIKVRPIPAVQEYASFVFPNFQTGVEFAHKLAVKRCQPATLRLVDNEQYKMGAVFKENCGLLGQFFDYCQLLYVTKYKGFDNDELSVSIAVFEGDYDDVYNKKRKVTKIAEEFDGFAAGGSHGKRGYMLTFAIAYMRDLSCLSKVVADSFETSVPWDRALTISKNVKSVISNECKKRNIKYFTICCRLTQVYDTGACLYFYFGFNMAGVEDALQKYEEIEALARDEIIACGGSLSHHHGVGKVRQRWYSQAVSPVGVELCKAVKRQLDPNNIFAVGNLWVQ